MTVDTGRERQRGGGAFLGWGRASEMLGVEAEPMLLQDALEAAWPPAENEHSAADAE
jgi:hypothetical protein